MKHDEHEHTESDLKQVVRTCAELQRISGRSWKWSPYKGVRYTATLLSGLRLDIIFVDDKSAEDGNKLSGWMPYLRGRGGSNHTLHTTHV